MPPMEPVMDLPRNATRTEVLHAAISADNFSDWLMVEAMIWRERAHDLFDQVDDLLEKQKSIMAHGRGPAVREVR